MAVLATASLVPRHSAVAQGKQKGKAELSQIDAVLRRAVEAKEVPGVVAMAANDKGVFYEGAFGTRDLAQGPGDDADTIFRLASMTKAMTSVAAMQLVEQGKLRSRSSRSAMSCRNSRRRRCWTGFDDAGAPRLRPAKRPITLRHLLTHTAGFGYEFVDADLIRYVKASGTPSTSTGKLASLRLPLVFDPGERWEYGINIDWVGRAVEAVSGQPLDVYFRAAHLRAARHGGYRLRRSRRRSSHGWSACINASPTGRLSRSRLQDPPWREFWSGGGGLYSTGRDYLVFLQMLMHQGRFNGGSAVAAADRRADGPEPDRRHRGRHPEDRDAARSNDVDFFPGIPCKWGLGYMINTQPGPNGRSAGSLTWAGIFNTYYWLDPQKRVAGVFLTQILPFADPRPCRSTANSRGRLRCAGRGVISGCAFWAVVGIEVKPSYGLGMMGAKEQLLDS